MYYNENITIYVKIFPAVNIHKRNIKGAHLLWEDIDYIMVLLQVHSYMHLFRILTTQIQNLKLNIRLMNIYLQLDIKAPIKLKVSIKYFQNVINIIDKDKRRNLSVGKLKALQTSASKATLHKLGTEIKLF